jgi:hypothetical protein
MRRLVAATAGVLAFAGGEGLAQAVLPSGGGRLPSPASAAVRFDVVAGGDLLIHSPLWMRAWSNGRGRYDFRPMFREIRPLLRRAGLALCHVETPMGAGQLSGYPVFNSPPELARAIAWAGWDACSTASNHAVDRGQEGIAATARALERAGVRHTGSFRSAAEARRLLLMDVRGVRVAFLSFTYGTNGIPPPRRWSVNLISERRITRQARRARRRGADLVLVNLHWGNEYVHTPTSAQTALARRLLGRGAVDLILGQHAHVVQPIRRFAGRFVVYGEGNLLSYQSAACCPAAAQDGLLAVARVRAIGDRAWIERVDYVPTRVRHPDFVVERVGLALRRLERRGRGRTSEALALRASYRRTVAVLGQSRYSRPLPLLP